MTYCLFLSTVPVSFVSRRIPAVKKIWLKNHSRRSKAKTLERRTIQIFCKELFCDTSDGVLFFQCMSVLQVLPEGRLELDMSIDVPKNSKKCTITPEKAHGELSDHILSHLCGDYVSSSFSFKRHKRLRQIENILISASRLSHCCDCAQKNHICTQKVSHSLLKS